MSYWVFLSGCCECSGPGLEKAREQYGIEDLQHSKNVTHDY